MTHKALIRRLQISCLGLDPVDPLRLLVDDVIEALRENAMREVQRLGQEIEQEPVKYSDYEPDGVHHNKPQQEPVAYINVEKRRLEFAEPMVWHTPTVVNLERIPLYTHQRKPLTDEDKAILEAVHRELDRDCDEGNAPGHSHRIKGVWDEDNGKLAGKPCAWCLTWAKFTTLIKNEAAHGITGEKK